MVWVRKHATPFFPLGFRWNNCGTSSTDKNNFYGFRYLSSENETILRASSLHTGVVGTRRPFAPWILSLLGPLIICDGFLLPLTSLFPSTCRRMEHNQNENDPPKAEKDLNVADVTINETTYGDEA